MKTGGLKRRPGYQANEKKRKRGKKKNPRVKHRRSNLKTKKR